MFLFKVIWLFIMLCTAPAYYILVIIYILFIIARRYNKDYLFPHSHKFNKKVLNLIAAIPVCLPASSIAYAMSVYFYSIWHSADNGFKFSLDSDLNAYQWFALFCLLLNGCSLTLYARYRLPNWSSHYGSISFSLICEYLMFHVTVHVNWPINFCKL